MRGNVSVVASQCPRGPITMAQERPDYYDEEYAESDNRGSAKDSLKRRSKAQSRGTKRSPAKFNGIHRRRKRRMSW